MNTVTTFLVRECRLVLVLVFYFCGGSALQAQSSADPTKEDPFSINLHIDTAGTASICGVKFWDLNCDSVHDPGEPLLPNYQINLSGSASATAYTDINGEYCFTLLQPGSYTVQEVIPIGQIVTYPPGGFHTVILTGKETVTGIDFGNCFLLPPVDSTVSRICGIKWNDEDGDGQWDLGESPLPGWPIIVTDGSTTFIGYTDSSGTYCFDSLATGTWTLSEGTQPGWSQTWPPFPGTYEFEVTGATPDTGLFGNTLSNPASICGVKWHDLNGNGIKEKDEPGLEGFTITLTGPVSHSIQTDSSGVYCFSGLPPGTFTVSEVSMIGFVQTFPASPGSYTIVLTAGEAVDSVNFGNVSESLSEWCCDYWVARYNYENTAQLGKAIVIDSKGNSYVTGTADRGDHNHYLTVAYDPHGNLLWDELLDGGDHLGDEPAAIALSPDEQYVYVTGFGRNQSGGDSKKDFLTVRYPTATGTPAVKIRYDGGREDFGTDIAVDPLGNVFVTGASKIKHGTFWRLDYMTIRYDKNLAPSSEVKISYDADKREDRALSLALSSGSGHTYVHVTGASKSGSFITADYDYATIKYDYDLSTNAYSQVWVTRYDHSSNRDEAYDIVVDASGDVIVTGGVRSTVLEKSYDYYTAKYTGSSGSLVWSATYDAGNQRDVAVGLAVDVSKNVIVTGRSRLGGLSDKHDDYATIRYSSTGTQTWVQRYDAGREDGATAIDVDNAGDIYVTGYSKTKETKRDYVTIKYRNSDGVLLWLNSLGDPDGIRYNGTGNKDDIPAAIKTRVYTAGDSLNACVWVTGGSYGRVNKDDFLTIRYPQYPDGPLGDGRQVFVDRGTGDDRPESEIPEAPLGLGGNYPNPFNPATVIRFTLRDPALVTIEVFDVLGRKTATLFTEELFDDGAHEEEFVADGFPSGVYFYRLTAVVFEDNDGQSQLHTHTAIGSLVLMK